MAKLEQWHKLGKQAKKVQQELFILLKLSNETNVPKSISNYISKSVTGMQEYKSRAEDRMFREYPDLDDEALKVFYGEDKE